MTVVVDVAAERAVLAGICQYGTDTFLEVADLVKSNTFSIDSNKVIFKCIEHVCKNDSLSSIDLPSILSSAKELNLHHIFEKKQEASHLNSILRLQVDRQNIRRFASKLRRLDIARLLYGQGGLLQEKMSEVDGTETIANLLGMAEGVIFDFTSMFDEESDLKPKLIGEGLREYIQYLGDNPTDEIGISTGYPEFDASIGGGLNPGLAMIGARMKVGKSTLAINIGTNIAERGIPVLYLDTEMIERGKYRDISDKITANLSNSDILDIKTGRYTQDQDQKERVFAAVDRMEKMPLQRVDIANKPFEDQLYIMRRWIQSEVGLNTDGTAKDCVILYDYLKNTEENSDAMREHQKLGLMSTMIQNLGTKYAVPILGFCQLNRDGIDGEQSNVIAGSDRIGWFCTSLSIFKRKSREEIQTDGDKMGNMKMVTIMSRYGPGHEFGKYAHLWMNKKKAQIKEVNIESIHEFGDEFIEQAQNDEQYDKIPFE